MAYFYFGLFEAKPHKKNYWFISAAIVILAGFFSLGMSFSVPNHQQSFDKSKYQIKFAKTFSALTVEKKKDKKIVLIDKQKILEEQKTREEEQRKKEEAAKLAAINNLAAVGNNEPISYPAVSLDSPSLNDLYQRAADAFNLDWRILAAVHSVESGQSVETSAISYAGAVGPMQFLPSTFNTYAIDGDGDGQLNIYDVDDAVFSAAHLLSASSGSVDIRSALYSYNHSWAYVDHVLAIANSF